MQILTASEAQELREHLEERPDIWIRAQDTDVFVRKQDDEYAVALCMREGQDQFFVLSVKAITWSTDSAQSYVSWLLHKYTTTWAARLRVAQVLGPHVRSTVDVNALTRSVLEAL